MAGRAAIQGGLPVVAFVMPLAFQLWQFVSGAGAAAAAEAEQRKKEAAEKRKASGKEGKEEEGETPGEVVSDSMGAMQWAIVVLFAALYGPQPPHTLRPTFKLRKRIRAQPSICRPQLPTLPTSTTLRRRSGRRRASSSRTRRPPSSTGWACSPR